MIIANATDAQNDPLDFSINDSRFIETSEGIFKWQTDFGDDGIYLFNVSVTDGILSDSQIVQISINKNLIPYPGFEERLEATEEIGRIVASCDVNNDGYDDLLVHSLKDKAYLILGNKNLSNKINYAFNRTDWSQNGAGFGRWLTCGDLNGDGFDDVVIASTARMNIYYQGARINTLANITISPPFVGAAGTDWIQSLAIGNVNNDGFGDLAVISNAFYQNNLALVYAGRQGVIIGAPYYTVFKSSVMNIGLDTRILFGDLNADNYDELVIGVPASSGLNNFDLNGYAAVYYGSPGGYGSSPNWTLANGKKNQMLGSDLSMGDFTNIGHNDLLVGERNGSVIKLYSGSADVLPTTPTLGFSVPEPTASFGGRILLTDINNDDTADAIISDRHVSPGRLYVWYGPGYASPDYIIQGEQNSKLGDSMVGGDFNRDGLMDFAVSDPYYDCDYGNVQNCGKVHVVHQGIGDVFYSTPKTMLNYGASSTGLNVYTWFNANCRHDSVSGTQWGSMNNFDVTGGTNHSLTLSLNPGFNPVYVLCNDSVGKKIGKELDASMYVANAVYDYTTNNSLQRACVKKTSWNHGDGPLGGPQDPSSPTDCTSYFMQEQYVNVTTKDNNYASVSYEAPWGVDWGRIVYQIFTFNVSRDASIVKLIWKGYGTSGGELKYWNYKANKWNSWNAGESFLSNSEHTLATGRLEDYISPQGEFSFMVKEASGMFQNIYLFTDFAGIEAYAEGIGGFGGMSAPQIQNEITGAAAEETPAPETNQTETVVEDSTINETSGQMNASEEPVSPVIEQQNETQKANLNGKIQLQGRETNNNTDTVTIQLKNVDSQELQTLIIETTYSGGFFISDILYGLYDIMVKPDYYLRVRKEGVQINASEVSIDFGIAGYGDFNNDNKVNKNDLSVFSDAYNSKCEMQKYRWYVDANSDCKINHNDLTVFSAGYGSEGAEGLG